MQDQPTVIKPYKRIFLIVTDSVGIGAPDFAIKNEKSMPNTLFHVSQTGLLDIQCWKSLGITSIAEFAQHAKKVKNQKAYTARGELLSKGNDSLSGHWEMMGALIEKPFPVFVENGFPPELITKLEQAFDGRKIVGNVAISGTTALDKWADEEINNNKIIVYTSIDSTLQICGHEKYMGLDKLYAYAKAARAICDSRPEWKVARIIARPYGGENGKWTRTHNRRDYGITPPHTLLNDLQTQNVHVISIGKISEMFDGHGINEAFHSESDEHGMDMIIDIAKETFNKSLLVFANLVDFDTLYGHRRNPEGYADNLNRFDIKLCKLINTLNDDDLLIVTSDHGDDPTMPGSDHTRELVPITVYSKSFKKKPRRLDDFHGLANIGSIIAKGFGVKSNVVPATTEFDDFYSSPV